LIAIVHLRTAHGCTVKQGVKRVVRQKDTQTERQTERQVRKWQDRQTILVHGLTWKRLKPILSVSILKGDNMMLELKVTDGIWCEYKLFLKANGKYGKYRIE
jgi:hypothetical protein